MGKFSVDSLRGTKRFKQEVQVHASWDGQGSRQPGEAGENGRKEEEEEEEERGKERG